ncbi:hypothetical protein DSUL_90082 [Desulfovibrionales bacterium]
MITSHPRLAALDLNSFITLFAIQACTFFYCCTVLAVGPSIGPKNRQRRKKEEWWTKKSFFKIPTHLLFFLLRHDKLFKPPPPLMAPDSPSCQMNI